LQVYRKVTAAVPGNMSASLPDPAVDELAVERRMEIRPTVNEIICAAARVSVTSTRKSRGNWSAPFATARSSTNPRRARSGTIRDGRVFLGATISQSAAGYGGTRGVLVRWKAPDGRWFKPVERYRGAAGGSRPGRSAASVAEYLGRPGTAFPAPILMPDGGAVRERPPAKLDLEAELRRFGVDGSVSFDQARLNAGLEPVRRHARAVLPALGVTFFGGVTYVGRGTPPAWDGQEDELADNLRRSLNPEQIELLDLAKSDATADEIGRTLGFKGGYARRKGVQVVDEALDALDRLAA